MQEVLQFVYLFVCLFVWLVVCLHFIVRYSTNIIYRTNKKKRKILSMTHISEPYTRKIVMRVKIIIMYKSHSGQSQLHKIYDISALRNIVLSAI